MKQTKKNGDIDNVAVKLVGSYWALFLWDSPNRGQVKVKLHCMKLQYFMYTK